MPLSSLSISYLQPSELATANKEFAAVLDKAPATATVLHAQKKEMLQTVETVEQRTGLKVLSSPLFQADVERDRSYISAKQLLRGFRYHFEPEMAAAADRLHEVFMSFGSRIDDESYAVESHKINALLAALKTPASLADARLLSMQPAINRIEQTQAEFERLRQSAIETEAQFDLPQMAQFIGPMRQLLDEAITFLRSFERREPETYKPLVAEMNQLIEDYAAKIKSRKTRRENEEKEASETPTPQN